MTNRPYTPLFATINVTTSCNLKCDYCFMQPLTNQHMKIEDFKHVLKGLQSQQVFFINISGGEPFAHPKITQILNLAHKSFDHVMVLSNGTLLKKRHEQSIREIIESGRQYTTQISLDALDTLTNDRTRGKTELVLTHIKRLTEIGANVVVATVVTRHNLSRIETLIRKLEDYTRHFHLMTVQDVRSIDGIEDRLKVSRQDEMQLWKKMAALAKERDLFINTPSNYEGSIGCAEGAPCMAAFSHLVVDPDLRVRPCDRLTDVYIGDLQTNSFEQIWHGDAVLPLLEGCVPFCRRKTQELVTFN